MDNHCSGQTQSSGAMAREHAYKIGLDILLSDLSILSHQRWQGPTAMKHLEHQWEDRPAVDNHCPGQI